MPFTTRGLSLMFGGYFRGTALPAHFYVGLCTGGTAPTIATKTLAELVEITAGNGYTTGGYQLTPNTTDFPVLTENDTRLFTELTLKAIAWTASGGSIPASGSGAVYIVLLTDEATVANRQVIWYSTFRTARTVTAGQTLTVTESAMRIRGGTVIKSTQRGTITIGAATSGTATIASVDTAKSSIKLLGVSMTNSGAQDPYTYNVTLALTNATTVTATRGANTITVTVAYEVVEYF